MNSPAPSSDLVILLPGFLGFDHFSSFAYFADRLGAALRGHLEATLERRTPVFPVTPGPTDDLATRQRAVLARLADVDRHVTPAGHRARFHLVGHSSGGLDAELLLCTALAPGGYTDDEKRVIERIASVTTIAAPLLGTCLSDSPVARFLAHPLLHLTDAPSVVGAEVAIAPVVLEQWRTEAALVGATPDVLKFAALVVARHGLIGDLSPARIAALRAAHPRAVEGVAVGHVVTARVVNKGRQPDGFFRYLESHTAHDPGPLTPELSANLDRLNAADAPFVAGGSPPLPHFDPSTNDGIVNSGRQLLEPGRPGALIAVVDADHADVIGHYDRASAVDPQRVVREGLFRSGADFDDDQFFELYRLIARRIAAAAAR